MVRRHMNIYIYSFFDRFIVEDNFCHQNVHVFIRTLIFYNSGSGSGSGSGPPPPPYALTLIQIGIRFLYANTHFIYRL